MENITIEDPTSEQIEEALKAEKSTNRFGTDTNKIYLLTNKKNGKIYIGQTWLKLSARMGKDGHNYQNSIYIYNAIQKHGAENFEYSVLNFSKDQETADKLEDYYINKYDSKNQEIGYNLKDGGSHGKHSQETRDRISKTQKEIADSWTEEERMEKAEPIRNWWEGKTRGPQSEERKEANSKFFIEWHANNEHPMLGKTHTEESKNKISETLKSQNRTQSDEHKAILREVNKTSDDIEKMAIEEYLKFTKIKDILKMLDIGQTTFYRILERNNIKKHEVRVNTRDGRTHTEDTKKKLSEMKKEWWDNKKTI